MVCDFVSLFSSACVLFPCVGGDFCLWGGRVGALTFSWTKTLGMFLEMSMSRVHFVMGAPSRAVRISTGSDVLILLHISAIFDPRPNFPRDCFTQYFVP